MNAVIIPARWSSTRFPGKPLHNINGKPLLLRTWERCRRARKIGRVIIATDDMRIAQAAFDWGAEVALTSKKHRSGTDRIAEVAQKAPEFSIVINVQGDEPLLEPTTIDRLVVALQTNGKIGMATAAHPFRDEGEAISPHQVKVVIDLAGNALYFSRCPIPFRRKPASRTRLLRHQGIYGFRRETLLRLVRCRPTPLERAESLEQLRALENGVTVHVLVTKQALPGIDTPEDAVALEQFLSTPRGRSAGR